MEDTKEFNPCISHHYMISSLYDQNIITAICMCGRGEFCDGVNFLLFDISKFTPSVCMLLNVVTQSIFGCN